MRSYIESEVYEARHDENMRTRLEIAADILKNNEPLEKIMRYTNYLKRKLKN